MQPSSDHTTVPWAAGKNTLKPVQLRKVGGVRELNSRILGEKVDGNVEVIRANIEVVRGDGTEVDGGNEMVGEEVEENRVEEKRKHDEEIERVEAFSEQLESQEALFTSLQTQIDAQLAELEITRRAVQECAILRTALLDAQSSVEHHESELGVLRDAIAHQSAELADAIKAREFAEAESRSKQVGIKELEKEKLMQLATLASLTDKLSTLNENHEHILSELTSTRQDLRDALDREARQEESSQSLLSAQSELELAYADLVAQLESRKGRPVEDLILGHATKEESEEDSEEDRTAVQKADGALSNSLILDASEDRGPNTTLDEYDVIDLEQELLKSTNGRDLTRTTALERPSFKSKLSSLVTLHRSKPQTTPSTRAVKLFAVRELEDELAEDRLLLNKLVWAFAETDAAKLKRLQRLQHHIDETMDSIRVTAIKLKAVRTFVE